MRTCSTCCPATGRAGGKLRDPHHQLAEPILARGPACPARRPGVLTCHREHRPDPLSRSRPERRRRADLQRHHPVIAAASWAPSAEWPPVMVADAGDGAGVGPGEVRLVLAVGVISSGNERLRRQGQCQRQPSGKLGDLVPAGDFDGRPVGGVRAGPEREPGGGVRAERPARCVDRSDRYRHDGHAWRRTPQRHHARSIPFPGLTARASDRISRCPLRRRRHRTWSGTEHCCAGTGRQPR